ncbi:unnamed protein product [Schistosoma curassoni]|uniref:Uncharacterized protein n=1 Tax=Schistosoma curassoni TaxID=6186 RepID=A0A183K509_9TREM|nr:unnamed protein product [Schistosoma curassoni]
MYLNIRVDFYSGTRTQYRSLQTLSRYPLGTRRASWIPLLAIIRLCL